MSNILRWNDVRADFGDTGRMFSAAQQGLSNAGTVFGQLRASILEEEQRRVDNAYKEKAFNEGVRQFGITSAETARGHDLTYKSSMAGHGVSRANALTSAGTARERLLYDMANQMSEATGNIPNYGNTPQGLKQQPYNNSPVMQGQYGSMLAETANRYGVPTDIFGSVIQQESGGNPNAVSPTGVVGIAQVTIPVMEKYGYTAADRTDPVKSADASARYLADLNKKYGNWEDALIAYNGGDGAVRGIKTGVFPETWKEQMRKVGVDPEQKIKEVQGYAAMAKRATGEQQSEGLIRSQRSIAGQRIDREEADRQRQEQFGRAIASATQDYQKNENEIRLLEKQRDLYDEGSPKRKEIEDEIAQKKANRKFSSLSELELALTTQYGSPEQQQANLSSNTKYERERALINAEAKREADKTKAKYLREDGQAIDKHLTTITDPDARIAAWKLMDEVALKEDITSEEKVRMAALVSGADTRSALNPINWVRGSSNEAVIDNLLVQIRKDKGSSTSGNQSTWSDKFEQAYGVDTLKDLRDKGFTDSDINNLDKFARLFAKNSQQGFFKGFSNRLAQTTGMDWVARNAFDSNMYSDPEPSADDFELALKFITKIKKDRDTKAKAKQTAATDRQAQINRKLKEEAVSKHPLLQQAH